MFDKMNSYRKHFSEVSFWSKIKQFARTIGLPAVYSALLLYYAYRRKETPSWAKTITVGALGYLISPIDALPDLTPVLGYTDDAGVLSLALVTIACYVNDVVKASARDTLTQWFGEYNPVMLAPVDKQL